MSLDSVFVVTRKDMDAHYWPPKAIGVFSTENKARDFAKELTANLCVEFGCDPACSEVDDPGNQHFWYEIEDFKIDESNDD